MNAPGTVPPVTPPSGPRSRFLRLASRAARLALVLAIVLCQKHRADLPGDFEPRGRYQRPRGFFTFPILRER
jgi:hypothetical protein